MDDVPLVCVGRTAAYSMHEEGACQLGTQGGFGWQVGNGYSGTPMKWRGMFLSDPIRGGVGVDL